MTPAVSVIIPTYNRAALLEQAILSVLQQTYRDYELIVVDDGSTDETPQVAARYSAHLRYVRTPHRGLAYARNVGFEQARGRYWKFLDSDDLLYPYALELGTSVLNRFDDLGFVCSEMSGFDEAGFFERYHLRSYHCSAFRDRTLTFDRIFQSSVSLREIGIRLPEAINAHPEDINRRVYIGNVFDTYLLSLVVAQNTAIMRREAVDAVGRVDERIRHWDFVDLLLRLCREFPVCFVDIPTYKVRYHAEQMSGTNRADGRLVWLRKQLWLLRVTRRHATARRDYYERHRARLERHLAHLYRAAAVPMLVADGQRPNVARYDRRARVYLAECRRLGHPEPALWCISYLPRRTRRFAIGALQHARRFVDRFAVRAHGA